MTDIIKRLKHCIANSEGLVHDEKQTMLDAIQHINELENRLENVRKLQAYEITTPSGETGYIVDAAAVRKAIKDT